MAKEFVIRTYGRSELAQLYNPLICSRSALRKLEQWIDCFPGLRAKLADLGLLPGARCYTPAMVKIIVGALGEP